MEEYDFFGVKLKSIFFSTLVLLTGFTDNWEFMVLGPFEKSLE